MKYILLKWFHNLENEPYIIYSEIDNQRYEVRKIEIYKNGITRKCDEKMINSQIELGDVAFPENLDEINHDIYRRGNDIEKIPRHKEVNESLARMILRKWKLL